MKLLIYGSNGWIASQVTSYLNSVNIDYIEGLARVDDIDLLEKEIDNVKPTHVLSLIGRTHGKIDNKIYPTIDYLEEPGKLTDNIRDNLFAPISTAILCDRKNIHFTYLGTGCIFESNKENLEFSEESLPNFFGSSYSTVKGFTDRLMHLFESRILNLRIRMPINSDNNARNFITKITNYDKICSIPNSMSVLPDLIPIMINMMQLNTGGTFNFTNPGVITHNEILTMYKEIVDPDFTWKNFSIDEQDKILNSKRSNNNLLTDKLKLLYPNVTNIRDAVKECLLAYKKGENKIINNTPNIDNIEFINQS